MGGGRQSNREGHGRSEEGWRVGRRKQEEGGRVLVLAWDCYIDILRYAAIWVHHQNLSIHLQKHCSKTFIDEFLRYFLSQSHSPFLTYAHINMERTQCSA